MSAWDERIRQLRDGTPESWKLRTRFRDQLRSARAKVQADAEGFEVVVHAIERLGRFLYPEGRSFGQYENALVDLVTASGGSTADLRAQLFLLRQTRNDFAHQGAHARNAAREAVQVVLRLEDALSIGWGNVEVRHVMVRDPVTTRAGDTLDDVRLAMLENSFTAIPALVDKRWYLLTDRWLAGQLAGRNSDARREVLREVVATLDQERLRDCAVELVSGNVKVSALVANGALQHALVLVVSSDPERLEGVLAPSDLL